MKTKVLGLAVLCALVTAVSSLGASQPIVARALAVGKMQATTIHAKSGEMILETYTIKPGRQLRLARARRPGRRRRDRAERSPSSTRASTRARRSRSARGQSFVEPANHVHLARNDGTKPATVYALYLGVPKPSGDVHPENRARRLQSLSAREGEGDARRRLPLAAQRVTV